MYDVGDIIDTHVNCVGQQDFCYSFATAVGLFQNVVAPVGANWLGVNLELRESSGSGEDPGHPGYVR